MGSIVVPEGPSTVGAVPASGQLSQPEVVVVPGDEEVVTVTVRNLGAQPETYALVATGFVQGWTVIDPPNLTLPPGGEGTARVALRPPRRWSVGAGPSPLAVRIVPQTLDAEVTLVEGTVNVLAFDERRLSLTQPAMRGKRRGEFDVVIDNLGNSRATCRLAVVNPDKRVTGRFDPPSFGLDPGGTTVARLFLKTKRRRWKGGTRTVGFEIQAVQEGHLTTVTHGTFLQEPVFTGRILRSVLGLAAIGGAVVGAWFGVVKPGIDDAASRAVERAAASTTTAAPVTSDPGAGQPGGSGANFDIRLAVSAALSDQAVQGYTVPAGQEIRITDVLMQNPNLDSGRLALLRNSTVLYEAALENFTDFPYPLVSPYVFAAGETINVQLTCRAIGGGGDSCEAAITVTGEIVPAS